jgi:uncharacterized membrane protein
MEKKTGTTVLGRVLTVVIILAILGSVGTLFSFIANRQTDEKFTEFYILNKNGLASDYPKQLKTGEEAEVIVGIINRESEITSYRIEVKIENAVIRNEGPIVLQPDEKYEQNIGFTFDNPGVKQKVEFILYKSDTLYQQLYLLADVSG